MQVFTHGQNSAYDSVWGVYYFFINRKKHGNKEASPLLASECRMIRVDIFFIHTTSYVFSVLESVEIVYFVL
jgi:hypothetical protein